MKVRLAWHNLLHSPGRTAGALAGTTFALMLVFAQIGALFGFIDTSMLHLDRLAFDIALVSPAYVHLSAAGTFPDNELHRVRAFPGVESADPLLVGTAYWRHVESGELYGVMMIGLEPGSPALPEVQADGDRIQGPDTVLADASAHPKLGPRGVGLQTEINGYKVEVTGSYRQGMPFGSFGGAIMNPDTFRRLMSWRADHVSLGLVKVAPGAAISDVRDALAREVGSSVRVLDRETLRALQRRYWTMQANVGIVFGVSAVLAMIVGTAVLNNVVSAEVSDRLPELATLKAMGYTDTTLTRLVFETGTIIVLFAYPLSFGLALVIYHLFREIPRIEVYMTFARAVCIFVLALGMVVIAGAGAVRRVREVDPAELL